MRSDPGAIRGRVFDIKRFALHDGPGIRTTAFIKGCPLACRWCQNPEGIPMNALPLFHRERCIRCERCVAACPHSAVTANPEGPRFIRIDRRRCRNDGSCIATCPSGALQWDSTEYTARELVRELRRDQVFYAHSGGGMTLSGGEPLVQPEFSRAVLQLSRDEGLHTAIETTLHAERSVLEGMLPVTDLFLTDIKLIDPDEHRRYTGVDNELILENVRFLAEEGAQMLIRTPLIPETTTTRENIAGIAAFVRDLGGAHALELINFNPLAAGKYEMLERTYPYAGYTAPLAEDFVQELRDVVRSEGVDVV